MLKPVDIQNHTLKTSMSGYNKKETDEFLAAIHESYESVLKENRELKDKITTLSEGIQYYKQMENTLQKALVLAEKTSSETQEAARVQADTTVKEAQEKADGIIKEAQEESEKIIDNARTETGSIKSEADAFVKESEAKADILIKEAQKKAEAIINKAENEALNIQSAAQQECNNINARSAQLLQNYEDYRAKLKKFALQQLDMLEDTKFVLPASKHEPEETDSPAGEKFSWNSDEYTVDKKPDNESESGFTFIEV